MTTLRLFLLAAAILIYAMTAIASVRHGVNWPAVAIQDLMALDWRSQFDTDFLTYLFLGALWIAWRQGFSTRGYVFAFLSIFLGGMFSFPYLLWATYQTKGDPTALLLGVHAASQTTTEETDSATPQ
ncbi:MAG: hypothetical protein AAFU85_34520 [Planctomycetota bacterium]